MRRSSWIRSLTVTVALVCLVGLLGMLFWSQSVMEERLKEIERGIRLLLDRDVGAAVVVEQPERQLVGDAAYPNLLEADPFYERTLPEMLGPGFSVQGTFYDATIGRPENLHPFSNWRQIRRWYGLCVPNLGRQTFGFYERFSPSLAEKIERREGPEGVFSEFWIYLRPGVFWEPLDARHFPADLELASHFRKRHRVTAHDVKFYYDTLMNPHVTLPWAVILRAYLEDIAEVRVENDLTLVVRWRVHDVEGRLQVPHNAQVQTMALSPLPAFVYQYYADGTKVIEGNDWGTSSVFAQVFSEHWAKNVIVSCGAWMFGGMTDREIRFRRNPRFYDPLAALMQTRVMRFRNAPENIWQEFKQGQLTAYAVQPNQLVELEHFMQSRPYKHQVREGKAIEQLEYLARSYQYIGWNQARPFFSSAKVRRAMTIAIDRQRIIQTILHGQGVEITGPFFVRSSANDPSIEPWPYDPLEAKRLLDEEGWYDSDGDGIRDKEIGGKSVPFRFSLTYFVKNPTSKAISEYVAGALKQVGVVCQLRGVDIADLSQVFDDRDFDALLLGWALGTPPENPRQIWSSEGANEKGSSNAIGFSNAEADALIQQLEYEEEQEARVVLYHRFHQIIHEEAPYTFLYTPKAHFIWRSSLKNVFIPAERPDLVPGATVTEPNSNVFFLRETGGSVSS